MDPIERNQRRIKRLRAAMRWLDKDMKRKTRERIRELAREIRQQQARLADEIRQRIDAGHDVTVRGSVVTSEPCVSNYGYGKS